MAKEKLQVPENCPLEIWVSDAGDEGCFVKNSIRLPSNEYLEIRKNDGSIVSFPAYVEIDLPEMIPGTQRFHYFAKGSFNAAFRNFPVNEEEDVSEVAKLLFFPPIVLKLPLAGTAGVIAQLDEAKRAARVFNECNAALLQSHSVVSQNIVGGGGASAMPVEPSFIATHFFGKAKVLGNGWLAPYIIGQQSASEQIVKRLIELFNENQRIVIDSYVKNNLLTDERGDTWVIDSGFALQLGFEDPIEEETDVMREKSPKSKASFCAWSAEEGKYCEHYSRHFTKLLFPTRYRETFKPTTAPEGIKKLHSVLPEMLLSMALLYIQKEYSEIKEVSCLNDKPELIQVFASAYIEEISRKIFFDVQEKIPALNIVADQQKLIDVSETNETIMELKNKYIDTIELQGGGQPQESFPETPASYKNLSISDDAAVLTNTKKPETHANNFALSTENSIENMESSSGCTISAIDDQFFTINKLNQDKAIATSLILLNKLMLWKDAKGNATTFNVTEKIIKSDEKKANFTFIAKRSENDLGTIILTRKDNESTTPGSANKKTVTWTCTTNNPIITELERFQLIAAESLALRLENMISSQARKIEIIELNENERGERKTIYPQSKLPFTVASRSPNGSEVIILSEKEIDLIKAHFDVGYREVCYGKLKLMLKNTEIACLPLPIQNKGTDTTASSPQAEKNSDEPHPDHNAPMS